MYKNESYKKLVIGEYLKQFNKVDVISKLTFFLPDMTYPYWIIQTIIKWFIYIDNGS